MVVMLFMFHSSFEDVVVAMDSTDMHCALAITNKTFIAVVGLMGKMLEIVVS